MNNERILERKFDKLNRLKSMLVSRVDVKVYGAKYTKSISINKLGTVCF